MIPSIRTKYACSSSSAFFRRYLPPRPTLNSSSGMKTTISISCLTRPETEKPRSKVETHIANTTSDSVSDSTVAPTVTVTGSSRLAPTFVTIDSPQQRVRREQRPQHHRRHRWIAEQEADRGAQQQGKAGRDETEGDRLALRASKEGKVDLEAREKHQQQFAKVCNEVGDGPSACQTRRARAGRARRR